MSVCLPACLFLLLLVALQVFGHPSGKSVAVLLDCSQAVEANSNPSEYRKMIKVV